jgi:hypothetical protein
MRWFPALAVALGMAGAGLAGCSSSPGAQEDAEPVAEITDPRDTSYLGNDQVAHVHNYWGGQDRVTVLDVEGGPFAASCQGCGDEGMTFSWQRPDEGDIVPQGTAWVNGTFTFEEEGENLYDSFELWVKTAADASSSRWGPIESGVPFSINTTQEQNDPPHYVLSLWEFEVRALGGDEIQVSGSASWSVEAVRGLPLVPYPPHPDRWNGAAELDLLQDTQSSELTYYQEVPYTGYTCHSGCPRTHSLPDGVVVPFETQEVVVTLSITDGIPAGLGLWYHGADTWEQVQAEGESSQQGTWTYTIPVEGSMADSPYAPQSLWEFRVWLDQPQPGLKAWRGTYTIEVVAYR